MNDQERVVLLNHEEPEDSVTMIAESFDDFLEGLERQSYLGVENDPMVDSDEPSEPNCLLHHPELLEKIRVTILNQES